MIFDIILSLNRWHKKKQQFECCFQCCFTCVSEQPVLRAQYNIMCFSVCPWQREQPVLVFNPCGPPTHTRAQAADRASFTIPLLLTASLCVCVCVLKHKYKYYSKVCVGCEHPPALLMSAVTLHKHFQLLTADKLMISWDSAVTDLLLRGGFYFDEVPSVQTQRQTYHESQLDCAEDMMMILFLL